MRHPLLLATFSFLLCLFAVSVCPAQSMDVARMQARLNVLLGDSTTWKPACVARLERGMDYGEVRKVFPSLPPESGIEMEMRSTSSLLLARLDLDGYPLLASYTFKFRNGRLYGLIMDFRKDLDRSMFKTASLAAFERKFGALSPEERNQDTINRFTATGLGAQRSWLLDHWRLEVDIP